MGLVESYKYLYTQIQSMSFSIEEYISESNAIERVYADSAIDESMEAWNYLVEQDELTAEVVKTAHEYILQNRQPHIAGEYRTVRVRVGNDVPPAPEVVEPKMEELLDSQPENTVEAIEWHVDFEKIHPFQDGNGRIGRLLYAWHCYQLNEVPIMWREEDKKGYYSLFQSK